MKEMHFGRIWFIPGPNKGRYPHCHSLYIEGTGILIDPAADRARLREIRNRHGVNAIILSHAHEDHLTHLGLFPDVPVWISSADAGPLTSIEKLLDSYGAFGEMRDYFRSILEEKFHFKPRQPQRLLKEGDIIEADGLTIEVIHTPGHTPGHLAFLFSEPRVLFLGDYDLTPFGPWYGDLNSSIDETIASVNRLRTISAEIWISGHENGLFTNNPGVLWQNYLDVICTREEKLMDALKTPRTLEEIARKWIVYNKPMKPEMFFLFNEHLVMGKHLDRLMKKGRVAKDGDRYVKL